MLLLVVQPTANIGATTSNAQTQPTIASGSAPALPPAPVLPAARVREGVLVGRSDGKNLTLAIAIKGDLAAGYLCDGKNVEAWLQGTVTGDQVVLHGKNGAKVTGTLSVDAIHGMITINSEQLSYTVKIAGKPAGLYEAREDGASRTGWIVLPDGSQVGVRNIRGERTPAPRLDTGQLKFDGSHISAKPVVPSP